MLGRVGVLRDLWLSRQARACAYDALLAFLPPPAPAGLAQPLSDGRRADWEDPYLVGFLATVISVIALHGCPALGHDGLGHVQRKVFEKITGLPGDLVGERIIALSLDGDADFLMGCADALSFGSTLVADRSRAPMTASDECVALWNAYVGKRLAQPIAG